MSNPPNPTNNDPNGSRASHEPLRDAEQYTAESIISDVSSASGSSLLPHLAPQVSNHLSGNLDARRGSLMSTIGRDRHSTQHIRIYNVFNFFPSPYLVNDASRGRQRVTSITTNHRPIVTFEDVVLIGAILVLSRHYFAR